MPEVVWSQARAEDLLPELDPASFDLIHLSNVLDWQTPESAAATLGACRRLLRPGGLVILRQLNSSLDIGSPGSGLVECRRLAADLHRRDRSFFYRRLYLFRKP
jgi:S-adenosylmethionine-diacylglycerol 3-amino-3-carboxypropyl transferase